jgi:hypothetical protein
MASTKPEPLTEAEYLHKLHGEAHHASESIEIDSFQFKEHRAIYQDLAEEAKALSNKDCRELLAGVFQIIDGPTYAAMPEEEKQVLEVQQYVLHRRLLNQPRG